MDDSKRSRLLSRFVQGGVAGWGLFGLLNGLHLAHWLGLPTYTLLEEALRGLFTLQLGLGVSVGANFMESLAFFLRGEIDGVGLLLRLFVFTPPHLALGYLWQRYGWWGGALAMLTHLIWNLTINTGWAWLGLLLMAVVFFVTAYSFLGEWKGRRSKDVKTYQSS